jgi:hypothetical protein
LLAGIGWLALAVATARGASIRETVTFTILAPASVNSPPQTINVSTPQFNPILGTFESATTTISGTVDTALEFFTTGAGGPYDVLLTDTLTLAGIPGLFGQELTGAVPANQPVFLLPVTIPFGPVDRGDPPGLVVGTGTWNQLYTLPFPSLTAKESPAAVLVPGLMISGSSVTTYTYTPATAGVPEPRFYSLLTLLFGFGLVARSWTKKSRITGPGGVGKPALGKPYA